MNDLKTCPFCGGKAILKDNGNDFSADGKAYYIVCTKCHAYFGNSKTHKSSAQTVSAWNRRAG